MVFSLRNNAYLADFTTQSWFDSSINEYVHMEANCTFEKENTPLKIWPGKSQPDKVVEMVDGNSRVRFNDSASATMQGTTAYVDLDGTLVTYATYAAALSVSDTKWNFVSG